MTLADDMRPEASPHIRLCQYGKCKVRLALTCMHTCHLICIGIVVVARRLNL